MGEFWESSFIDKQEMWGSKPVDSAISTSEFFKQHGAKNVLIPGFGYGRNAKIFLDSGMAVTGIEISQTAIDLASKHFGGNVKIHHGSVNLMPFDEERYDGIYCYALLHLLNQEERKKFIKDCYSQLKSNGYMVFISLSKGDLRFGEGKKIDDDTFETKHGINLFFYDSDSVKAEFEEYGLIEANEENEPSIQIDNKPPQKFWKIVCRK